MKTLREIYAETTMEQEKDPHVFMVVNGLKVRVTSFSFEEIAKLQIDLDVLKDKLKPEETPEAKP